MDSNKVRKKTKPGMVVCKQYIVNSICMKSWISIISYRIDYILYNCSCIFRPLGIIIAKYCFGIIEEQGLLVSKYRDKPFQRIDFNLNTNIMRESDKH